ncbi:hypothetical protein [Chitinophaga sp.]|uniref:hypothetical protein n=1 Tax=Chitinophaga sp. TaxID=1869181 RepID=UPI0031D4E6B1
MSGKVIQNERTALAQNVINQPDGPGKRIGKRSELALIGQVNPDGGAELFRSRIAQFQAEAAYWETRVGTVHDFRITLIDNDTRLLFMITYDGDFKPYVQDIIEQAHPWFDAIFPGIWVGYKSAHDAATIQMVVDSALTADFLYVAHPDLSVHDISKMKKLSKAVNDLFDAAS